MDVIDSFSGIYEFLSNFYPSPIDVDGIEFPTVENAFQARKVELYHQRLEFADLTPGQAKRLGRKVKLRDGWNDMRIDVMEELLRIKFSNPFLRQLLIDTGNRILIEGNNWNDTFWGMCNGQGQNHLGILLMKIRKELKKE